MKARRLAWVVLGLAKAISCAQGQDLVTNGGFETGDFSGWTLTGDPFNNFVETGFTSEGDFAAWFGEIGGVGTLTQSLSTVVGANYVFSFDFAGNGDNPSFFAASFGGNRVLSIVNPGLDLEYAPYSYSVTAVSTETVLNFTFRDDDSFINLDNVRVTAEPVPEPASLLAVGAGALGLRWRRRRG